MFWRMRGIDKADITGIRKRAIGVKARSRRWAKRRIDLYPPRPHLARIGEITAQHAQLPVGNGRLTILTLRPEGGEVHRCPTMKKLRFQAELIVIDLLGFTVAAVRIGVLTPSGSSPTRLIPPISSASTMRG